MVRCPLGVVDRRSGRLKLPPPPPNLVPINLFNDAIMQLVEDGKIDLSAPVSRYLDGLPAAWQPITIRQLLTHVSGLPNILRALDTSTYGLGNGATEETIWTKTKALPVESGPGERFSYNQTNYALLGKIIDKFAGKPFAQ